MPAFLIWLLDVNSDVSGTRTDAAASLSGGDDERSSFKCAPASGNPWPEHRDFSPRSTVLLKSIGILLAPVSKSATGSPGWIHSCFLSGKRCSHNIEECLKSEPLRRIICYLFQLGEFWEDDLQSVAQVGYGRDQKPAFSSQSYPGKRNGTPIFD